MSPFRQLHVRECASRRIPIPLIIKAKVLNPQFALIRAPNGRSAGVRKGSQDRATVIPHRNPDWARRRRQRSIWLAGGASIRAVLTALYSRMSAFLRRASGSSRPNCSRLELGEFLLVQLVSGTSRRSIPRRVHGMAPMMSARHGARMPGLSC